MDQIMLSIHKYFHWLYYSRRKKHLFIFFSGLFIWLFLAVTQPFGIYNSNLSDLVLFVIILPVGLIWIFIVYCFDFLNARFFNATVSKNAKADLLLWGGKLIAFIHVIFVLRGSLCAWTCVNLLEYFQLWLAMSLMFGFCYFPFMYYAKSIFFQDIVIEGSHNDSDFVIPGTGGRKQSVKTNQIIYLRADDNYVELFLLDEANMEQKMLIRATLSTVEDHLKAYSQFVRIHRSYVINVDYFETYTRGSNTLSLSAGARVITLPVSRKYKPGVSKLFTNPK